MFRKPAKHKTDNPRQSSHQEPLNLDNSSNSSTLDETSKKGEECSTKIESSSPPSPSMPDEMYKPERAWLEPMTDEKGEILHFAGLRPQKWAPHLARLYNDEIINRTVERINSLKSFNSCEAFERLREFSHRAPRRVDVLEYCVNFSKECRDINGMEGYLRCILELNPLDEATKRDRFEILHLVDEQENKLFSRIDALLEEFKSRPLSLDDPNNPKLFRERLIYNTVVIEGNTMTLIEVSQVLNTNARIKGHSDREHLEVKGMDEVLKLIEEKKQQGRRLSTKTLTLEDILEIHRYVLLDWPKNAGKLRETNIYITNVPFEPVDHMYVEEEMKKVIRFINNKPPEMHPVEFAALVHYSFVYVHPFADGNGRTSRILMNIALDDYGYPELIVPCLAGQRYFDSLYSSQMGDIRQFIRYIGKLTEERLRVYVTGGNYSMVENDDSPHTVVVDEKTPRGSL